MTVMMRHQMVSTQCSLLTRRVMQVGCRFPLSLLLLMQSGVGSEHLDDT